MRYRVAISRPTKGPKSKQFSVMDVSDDNETYVNLLQETPENQLESSISSIQNEQISSGALSNNICTKQDSHKLNNAIWTTHATSILLKLYEAKLEMLQTPKKKTKIWIAISEKLKNHDIDVTPDQVRWKINALTKKYKHCINMGKHEKFRYFKEMDKIYTKYNVDCNSYLITEFLSKKSNIELVKDATSSRLIPETRAMIEMRKARLANRINCDRFQGKIKLERQWLEYLHRQEEQRQFRDKIFERNLILREEKLEARKRELEAKESLEYRNLQIMEKVQEEFLLVERQKLDLLKQMFQ